jgi:hypothetical protein
MLCCSAKAEISSKCITRSRGARHAISACMPKQVPEEDREAMISATIHLGNRDWDALITDFVALGFLPENSDRRRIIPVMDTVLSPYLRGGGAKALNFQASSASLLQHPAAPHAMSSSTPCSFPWNAKCTAVENPSQWTRSVAPTTFAQHVCSWSTPGSPCGC